MNSVEVKQSAKHGKGLFATRDFSIGEVVVPWENVRTLTNEEVQKLPSAEKEYISAVEHGRYVHYGEPERYMNHSCEPNTKAKDSANVAIRDIKKGEEITTDYELEGALNAFKCDCGSTNCRGIIGKKYI